MKRDYIPDAGDIVWMDFDPQAGHEQAGHRPALVLSPAVYNGRIGLLLCCPMTTKIKGYPFEVRNGEGSAVLADQGNLTVVPFSIELWYSSSSVCCCVG